MDAQPTPAEVLPELSGREREVFLRLAAGESLDEIAAALQLHPSTISTYRCRIAKKMGIERPVDMAHFAIARRLIRPKYA